MASVEAVRALRSLLRLRAVAGPQQLRPHQRTICNECSARLLWVQGKVASNRRRGVDARRDGSHKARRRWMATVTDAPAKSYRDGPMAEYDARVHSGRLREDSHQRSLIQALQDLHDTLVHYSPPKVVHPSLESLQPKKKSLFGSMFGGGGRSKVELHPYSKLPKGLYMYGDVGSGKTMLMDLFYDTLPPNITHKTRIHFHNFMQGVHKELHKIKTAHGNDIDAIPFVAADIAEKSTVLCFDEFQCTDVADAMILRRLMEGIMSHGTVLVTTSNRHPRDLYKNGIQRDSFIPCINLLSEQLRVLNLDSSTDYRKIPRPPSGVYHHPLDAGAKTHADTWFRFLGDFEADPPHQATHSVWGREVTVPHASGRAARFTFQELLGRATGAADYIELARTYDAFVVTDVPGMDISSRDVARRFITFVDAAYETRAKLVLTTAVPLSRLFLGPGEVADVVDEAAERGSPIAKEVKEGATRVNDAMRSLMDDLGMSMEALKSSSIFTGDEEAFAFARALSRLSEMGSQEWVERGMGLEKAGGRKEAEDWQKTRSSYHQDSY